MTQQENRFKILLIGDQSVGKSTFVTRHLTGEFTKEYEPTQGVYVHPLVFNTNYGQIILDIWDVAGDDGGLFDGYCMCSDGLILMFDVMNKESYKHLGKWKENVGRVCGPIPTVVCGNKVDLKDRVVKPKTITFHRKHPNTYYYDISAKSNYNYEKPFLWLMRKLTEHQDLEVKS